MSLLFCAMIQYHLRRKVWRYQRGNQKP